MKRKSQFNRDVPNDIEESDEASDSENAEVKNVQGDDSDMNMDSSENFIGPISESERRRRVLNYLKKKYNKIFMKKFCYSCRKQVAEKRLRIKGRFVTKEQAFEILGLTQDQLLDNAKI